MKFLRTILVLGRVSNLPTVWTNCMAAWFLAGGTWGAGLGWMMAAGSLLYVGGMALNDAFDAKWDKEHGKDRPIVRGDIAEKTVWILGSIAMLAGAVLAIASGAAWWWVLGLIGAILAYDAFHKRWEGSIFIMGACRMLLFVMAASALTPLPGMIVWMWASALLAYVAGVTLAARGEDMGGTVKGLAVLLLALPVALGLMVVVLEPTALDRVWLEVASRKTWIELGVIGLLLSWLVLSYQRLHKTGSIGGFVASLLAGMVLVDAVAVSSVSLYAASICAVALPLNRLLQRYVPAT